MMRLNDSARQVQPQASSLRFAGQGIVDAIDRANFAAALAELAHHPTRHSLSTHFQDAARQAADRLRLMGYQVSLENVRIPGGNTLITYSNAGTIVELDPSWNEVQTLTVPVGYASWRPTLYGPPLRP